MTAPMRQITARWVQRGGQRRLHIAATRDIVTTEAFLTEPEASELYEQMGALLAPTPPGWPSYLAEWGHSGPCAADCTCTVARAERMRTASIPNRQKLAPPPSA